MDLKQILLKNKISNEIEIINNCCVIKENKPVFSNINDMLVDSTWQTQNLLQKELELDKSDLDKYC